MYALVVASLSRDLWTELSRKICGQSKKAVQYKHRVEPKCDSHCSNAGRSSRNVRGPKASPGRGLATTGASRIKEKGGCGSSSVQLLDEALGSSERRGQDTLCVIPSLIERLVCCELSVGGAGWDASL